MISLRAAALAIVLPVMLIASGCWCKKKSCCPSSCHEQEVGYEVVEPRRNEGSHATERHSGAMQEESWANEEMNK